MEEEVGRDRETRGNRCEVEQRHALVQQEKADGGMASPALPLDRKRLNGRCLSVLLGYDNLASLNVRVCVALFITRPS